MKFIVKQGRGGKYRAMLYSAEGECQFIPSARYRFDTPAAAAEWANEFLAELSRNGASVETEAGEAWYFGNA